MAKETAQRILEDVSNVIEQIEEEQVDGMIKQIIDSDSVFIVGSGRSELVGKAFAMRLMHLGLNVQVVGDVTTPAIKRGDCLIAISGSGETRIVTIATKIAKEVGARVVGITTKTSSTLGKHLDLTVEIKSKSKKPWKHPDSEVLKGKYDDLEPMGTLFEDSTHILLDGVIAQLMIEMKKT